MRDVPAALAAHLAGGATTLARCWRLVRRDGPVLGFTDHDRTLRFDGVDHEPAAGFTASEIPASLGLAAGTADIVGALVSPALAEDDIKAGLFDDAGVELWLVNWADPGQRALLQVGSIGEITRQGAHFKAEVRSPLRRLDEERGRVFQAGCDATLGDGRCRADLTVAGRRGEGAVASTLSARTIVVSGLGGLAAGACARGRLRWTSGPNAGLASDVAADRDDPLGRALELWDAPAHVPAAGDAFTATVGCDKRFATCRDRFGNAANFRGFPHIPGNDFAVSYARSGGTNDGGKLA